MFVLPATGFLKKYCVKMKIFYPIILTIFMAISCTTNNISVVDGTWEGPETSTIRLFSIVNGNLHEIAASTITDDGKFYFAFESQKEAFYVIGPNAIISLLNNTFYFKPGDNLNVTIDNTGYRLVGKKNSPENREMAKWAHFIRESGIRELSLKTNTTFRDFFPALDNFNISDYKQEYTSNKIFNKHFSDLQNLETLFYALNILITPRQAHPNPAEAIQYYSNILLSDITKDDALLNIPYGERILASYFTMSHFFKGNSYTPEELRKLRSPIEVLDVVLPKISDDKIKGEAVVMQSKYIRTYPGFIEYNERFGRYLTTEDQKERFNQILSVVGNTIESHPAIDFRFPDKTGKQIALSDLKGKVVYVDIWATWCNPCLAEIPHLKELEREYSSKDIIFLGVSTDKEADKEKWQNFLKEKELVGIQLFAGDRAQKELLRPYNITGIPRFLLIGKDGKVISSNAPRPSSSEIRAVLNDALRR